MFSVFFNRFIHELYCKLESSFIQSLININWATSVCQVKGGHWLPQIHLLSRVAQTLGIRHICTRDTKTYTHMLLWMKNDSHAFCTVEKRQRLYSNGGKGHEFPSLSCGIELLRKWSMGLFWTFHISDAVFTRSMQALPEVSRKSQGMHSEWCLQQFSGLFCFNCADVSLLQMLSDAVGRGNSDKSMSLPQPGSQDVIHAGLVHPSVYSMPPSFSAQRTSATHWPPCQTQPNSPWELAGLIH